MLLSGPAGGVTGAVWMAEQCGYPDLITFDMGGTSTDVALVQGLTPRIGRETKVGDLTVRASSVDVRTVGAGGGSIAHVPELTKALRVGPQSAGADPGPAAYGKGGTEPTVTDANVVLGYLPAVAGRRRDHARRRRRPGRGGRRSPTRWACRAPEAAAAGIVDIVNENMLGGLRLVSVQQGFDPRDFALVAFGGAGPLHANALGRLTGAWPVIVPPSPGVLCALGDATTSARSESARTVLRRFADLTGDELRAILRRARRRGRRRGSPSRASPRDRADHRATRWTCATTARASRSRSTVDRLAATDLDGDARRPRSTPSTSGCSRSCSRVDHELVNARATVTGPAAVGRRPSPLESGDGPPTPLATPTRSTSTGGWWTPTIYDRAKLRAGDVITGPAIVTEMDSTTLVLPGHAATVHPSGSLLIRPGRAGGLSHGTHRRDRRPAPSSKADVDPVTLDLIENGLRNARYEMDEVLFRTALSPGIREQHDEFPLIADPDGKMVVGQFGLSIPDFLDGFDGTIEEGDVLLTSDPYACGAAISHANDWLIVMPIFHEGRVVGWASMFGHMSDVGGKTPCVDADRRAHDLRGGRGHPALQAVREGRAQRGRAADHPQPGARCPTGTAPTSTGSSPPAARPRRRVRRDVRAVRHRHLPRPRSTPCCSATTTR